MDGDERKSAIREVMRLASGPGNRDGAAQHAACGSDAECQHPFGPDEREFVLKPPATAFDLVGVGSLVQAPLAAHLVFEMLDCVGDERVTPRDSGFSQRLIQNLSRRADKRFAGEIFLVAWLLADD